MLVTSVAGAAAYYAKSGVALDFSSYMLGSPKDVEYDAQSQPMYLHKEGNFASLAASQEGTPTSVIPYQFWTEGKKKVFFKSNLPGGQGFFLTHHTPDGKQMMANRKKLDSWEMFKPEYLGNYKFAFKASNGKYITCDNGKAVQANRPKLGPWEQFQVYTTNDLKVVGVPDTGDTYVALKSVAFGTWVTVNPDDTVSCDSDKVYANSKWQGLGI